MVFLLVSVAVFNLAAIFVPKRISLIEIYGIVLFTSFLQLIVDAYLDLKYDLYGYFDKGVDFGTLIIIFGVYPAINILVVNFFPTLKGKGSKTIYILAWSAFAVAYELSLLYVGVFYHNGWHIWYSALIYPFLVVILLLHWNLIKYLTASD